MYRCKDGGDGEVTRVCQVKTKVTTERPDDGRERLNAQFCRASLCAEAWRVFLQGQGRISDHTAFI